MSIASERELEALRRAGRVVDLALKAMRRALRAGITTARLDEIGGAVLAANGARSAPRLVYDFPGETCISVNDEVVHGIPGERTIRPGDLVTLDVTAELNGYYADAAITVAVPPASTMALRLVECAEAAFHRACRLARRSAPLRTIGGAVEAEVRRRGFRVIRELCGHGIGRTIHEPPQVLNYRDARVMTRLTEGLVLTIEPLVSAGSGRARLARDRWTVVSADGSLTAHHEHTLVVTRGQPIILTAA